jgi:hypothetical protein
MDDCDYNGHLSNSAFGKNLDHARSKGLVELFPGVFAHKCWMALGGVYLRCHFGVHLSSYNLHRSALPFREGDSGDGKL